MNPAASIDRALARAVLYRALADGMRPPDPAAANPLDSSDTRATLHGAARLLDDGDVAAALAALPPRVSPELLRDDFERLFGHTARGAAPLYETEYGEEEIFRQAHELADLAGFYRAFGLEVPAGRHERPDHASCECEFLSLLCLKEAFAVETGDEDMRLATAAARRQFLRDHLGHFGRAFGLRLARVGGGFYGALGRALERFLAAECDREGVALGPDTLGLRPMDLSAIPAACASCPGPGGEPP